MKCDLTEDCCGTATCVLPSWSPTPVCLVPGYKEDEKLARMSSYDPPRRKDIIYLRDTYNTTFFDFLLTDFTTDSPLQEERLKVNYSTVSEPGNASGPEEKIRSPNLGNFNLEIKVLDGTTTEGRKKLSASAERYFREKTLKLPFKPKDILQPTLKPVHIDFEDHSEEKEENIFALKLPLDLTKLFNDFKLVIGRRHRFLLLNSNITINQGKPTVNEIYEMFRNSDKHKIIIQLLHEKLRRLNDKENSGPLNVALDDLSILKKTESSETVPNKSKWSMVRKFFLRKSNDRGNAFNQDKFVEAPIKAVNQPRETEGIEELMEKFYIRSNVDSGVQDKKLSNEHRDDGLVEIFNINYPYKSDRNTEFIASKEYLKKSKLLNSLEHKNHYTKNEIDTMSEATLFKTYSTKSSEKMETAATNIAVDMQNYQQFLNESFSYIKKILNSLQQNNENGNIQILKVHKLKTESKKVEISDKAHTRKGSYLHSVHKNSSKKLTGGLKNAFNRKENPKKSTTHERRALRLNEHLLLAVNSKNFSEKMADYFSQSESDGKDSLEFSFDSSLSKESTSQYREGLYNDSYVFMVREDNSSFPEKKQSKLERILNFFHRAKSIPCPKTKNPCTNTSSCEQNESSKPLSLLNKKKKCFQNPTTEQFIELPESLMPEALELRRANDSSEFWFFNESDETLNEEHNNLDEQHTRLFNFLLFVNNFVYKRQLFYPV
ncbi:hypothetical protein J6590_075965 [Homalodisca vitripennis]|nr:hypothetical protein J6590_075965 [Homalodisca vitripennis]